MTEMSLTKGKNGSCDEIGSRAGQFEKRVHSMAGSGEVEIL